ncbi:hypothetical protein GCM10010435_24540 [Winogradskya consettensis]|uniref:YCII-related domain-containing protein n=1 Tax=Winogradskya consettensis TaxID=113560 RepID=A0A919SZT4_9ACTN|nr:hypothetical protein [Actinoplanes consettensis]GIM82490.1 hypothetical protein Aco04nite_81860 [Actinoplanes consettensis]
MRFLLLLHEDTAGGSRAWSLLDKSDRERLHRFEETLTRELFEEGELIDAQSLAPPELAGWAGRHQPAAGTGGDPVAAGGSQVTRYWLVDVDSQQRAAEIADLASRVPGPQGSQVARSIEIRQALNGPVVDF